MEFTQTELVAASNLQKLLAKQRYDLDAKGVVETYHAFNFLDQLVDHIENCVKARSAIAEGTLTPNKEVAKKTTKKVTKKK